MKFDADTIIHIIAVAREFIEGAITLALICGGLALIWFAGCAVA